MAAKPLSSAEITQLRTRLGETQAQFARRCQVDRATVHRWEHGEPPPPGTALALLRLLWCVVFMEY